MSFFIGDYVTRKSYNNDIVFKIVSIKDSKVILKGKDVRLIADSEISDLVLFDRLDEEPYVYDQFANNKAWGEKFDDFVFNHPQKSHFLQSQAWGEFSKIKKNLTPHYLGLIDQENEIIAATLLLEKKLPLNLCYFYAPRGFVIDYKKKEILKIMTQKIVDFAKKRKAIFVKIDPDIKLHDLDIEGNVINNTENNENLVKFLQKIGYRHLGFNKNFENNQPRYTFRLSLEPTIEEITKAFHPTTKK